MRMRASLVLGLSALFWTTLACASPEPTPDGVALEAWVASVKETAAENIGYIEYILEQAQDCPRLAFSNAMYDEAQVDTSAKGADIITASEAHAYIVRQAAALNEYGGDALHESLLDQLEDFNTVLFRAKVRALGCWGGLP